MTDEETKQILRDILAAQKRQLEYLQSQDSTYTQHVKEYDESTTRWKKALETTTWVSALRAITALGVVILLAYVIIRGH
jgi:hypothetical protein